MVHLTAAAARCECSAFITTIDEGRTGQ